MLGELGLTAIDGWEVLKGWEITQEKHKIE
jgi:hypothetical protein